MPRRRIGIALLACAATTLTASASALPRAKSDSAGDVRSAVLAAAVYAEDNRGSYLGMTVAKLRRYVRVRNVVVRRATRRTYCIENISGRRVHFDGPRGPLRTGRCGVRGTVVPNPGSPPPTPQPTDAQRQLKTAGMASLAYYADNGSYAGMTVEKLRVYDKSITGVTLAWASARDFCLQNSAGIEKFHVRPSDFKVTSGNCPAPPS